MHSTVKACFSGAGPNVIRKCLLLHYLKITTREDYENERITRVPQKLRSLSP